jgi:hypothetical protein
MRWQPVIRHEDMKVACGQRSRGGSEVRRSEQYRDLISIRTTLGAELA